MSSKILETAGLTADPWLARFAVTQGLLGGITVLYLLPSPVSISHATLAQTFFCVTVLPATAHVAIGALILATGWLVTLRAHLHSEPANQET